MLISLQVQYFAGADDGNGVDYDRGNDDSRNARGGHSLAEREETKKERGDQEAPDKRLTLQITSQPDVAKS